MTGSLDSFQQQTLEFGPTHILHRSTPLAPMTGSARNRLRHPLTSALRLWRRGYYLHSGPDWSRGGDSVSVTRDDKQTRDNITVGGFSKRSSKTITQSLLVTCLLTCHFVKPTIAWKPNHSPVKSHSYFFCSKGSLSSWNFFSFIFIFNFFIRRVGSNIYLFLTAVCLMEPHYLTLYTIHGGLSKKLQGPPWRMTETVTK